MMNKNIQAYDRAYDQAYVQTYNIAVLSRL